MPRIDGPLLRRAINLFAKGKSCADDHVVAEMLTALDEDVIDMMAEAFEKRILNKESHNDGLFIKKCRGSRFVEYPEDESVERKDGRPHKRTKNIVHVEEDMVMTILEESTAGGEGASRPARKAVFVGNGTHQARPGSPTSDTTDPAWQPLVDALWRTHEVSLLTKIANAKW